MRVDERMAEDRASEIAYSERDDSYDDRRREELEFDRRDDYDMNYEEE